MNAHVQPDVSGDAQPCLSSSEPLNTVDLAMKLLAIGELAEDLGRLAANEDDGRLALHMKFVGSAVSDTSSALLNMLTK